MAELGSGARWHFAATTLEVTFLAGDLVRYEWAGGEVPLPYALGRDTWPPATTHLHKVADGWRLEADGLAVLVSSDGSLCFYDAERRLLRREHPPERRGTSWIHRAGLLSGERIYGLGERAASFDLRGRTYRLWNLDPGGAYDRGTDPVYLCIPVYLGLHPLGSYLYFCENPFDETTDAGTSGRRRLH